VICGIAATVKFSGLLLLPIVATTLLVRAAMRAPWQFLGLDLHRRASRLLAVIATGVAIVVVTWLLIWTAYGFRFGPTPVPGELFDINREVGQLKQTSEYLRRGEWISDAATSTIPTPAAAKAVLWLDSHRALPQAWLCGFIFTYRSVLMRGTFLLGQYSDTGWWYYFPLAMLFKTPLATLAAIVLAITFARRARIGPWSLVCLGIPLAFYGYSALTSHLNLGLRHVLPLYPFIYLLVALVISGLSARRWFKPVAATLCAALVLETLLALPHYISFFNAASRPFRLWLLSDSNFDWGQDLPYVTAWQQRNPKVKLYLGTFGTVDPAFCGIRYANLPGGYFLNRDFQWPSEPGVVALSATLLQGVDCPPSLRKAYEPFREHRPREVLGDSIYLFDWPLRDESNARAGSP
jgi:hypothetical protein